MAIPTLGLGVYVRCMQGKKKRKTAKAKLLTSHTNTPAHTQHVGAISEIPIIDFSRADADQPCGGTGN